MAKTKNSHHKRFAAIDGNSLVHRAFHAFPAQLSTSDGVQVNAVYGFTSMLLKVLDELDPKYLVCAFDLREPTFRHTEFTDYKATRKPTDKTLIDQVPMVRDVVKAFNIPILEKIGYEADDVLGTLAEYAREGRWRQESLDFVIVTGDKDLLQVVGENIQVWLPHGSFKDVHMYGQRDVEERFGFGPEFIPDFKGLTGDSSDNIPGVKGIGEKSATDLIRTFGHLEGIYKNLDKVKERQKKLLLEGEESADMSRRLAEIVTTVDLEVKLEDCLMRDFVRADVINMFQRFEFRSLMNKIPESVNDHDGVQMGMFGGGAGKSGGETGEKIIGGEEIAANFSEATIDSSINIATLAVFSSGACALGIERKGTWSYYHTDMLTSAGVVDKIVDILTVGRYDVVTYGWEKLWRQLMDRKVGGKEYIDDKTLLRIFGTCGKRVFDVSLASYHLSSGQRDYSLKELAFTLTGAIFPEKGLDSPSYAKPCIDTVFSISETLRKSLDQRQIEQSGEKIYQSMTRGRKKIADVSWQEVESPLSIVLGHMSSVGVAMDLKELERKQQELLSEKDVIEKRIYKSIGHEFNISSSRQLADVLFEELSLPVQKKGKSGPSTDESVLQKLKGAHPCIEDILSYREVSKMENTYVTPLIEYVRNSTDGRVHSIFKQTGTTTGRLSSRDPNLQNIPIRSELGKEIRDMFIASKGKLLLAGDYSQIDLRIMAHYSEDAHMMEDFSAGLDFHTATAARVLGKKIDDVTKDDRRIAKTINFGVLYGLSPYGLSETLSIERDEAAQYIESYFNTYEGVRIYLEEAEKTAQEKGFIETGLGRRRYISGLKSGNRIRRSASIREAINTPIQGTSADIMRLAMNDLYEYILEKKDVDMVLQIHDEFLFECDRGREKKLGIEVKEIMENALKLKVPLVVEVECGTALASMKSI